jgi:Fic/DOC family N-terminal
VNPFVPRPLPRNDLDWAELVPLIARANRAIARYDGIVQGLVNPSVLLSPLAAREAVLSSMIEGTQTTLEELLEFEADPREDAGPRYDDIREVMNYRVAMSAAVEELVKRPLSLHLFLRIHSILMDSVRGRDKRRGEFRKEQNWIGPLNTPLENATYVRRRMLPLPGCWTTLSYTFMPTRGIASFRWPLSTASSNSSIRFSMATVGLGGCSFRCSCLPRR